MVADFIVKFTLIEGQGVEVAPQWSIHTNRSLNKQARGVGMVLCSPEGDNEVEYKALVVGLDLARVAGAENMVVCYDSQVVPSQVNGDYECKNERMKKYLEEVKG